MIMMVARDNVLVRVPFTVLRPKGFPWLIGADRKLCLVLEVIKNGQVVNRDEQVRLTITARSPTS